MRMLIIELAGTADNLLGTGPVQADRINMKPGYLPTAMRTIKSPSTAY